MTTDTKSDALRHEVRAWLQSNVPDGWREAMTNVEQDAFVAAQKDWFEKLSKAGYATPHWPQGWIGGGRSLAEQKIIFEEAPKS